VKFPVPSSLNTERTILKLKEFAIPEY
jgi:hypothetical protein